MDAGTDIFLSRNLSILIKSSLFCLLDLSNIDTVGVNFQRQFFIYLPLPTFLALFLYLLLSVVYIFDISYIK